MSEGETDIQLLERWRKGDNPAGSLLVKRHFDALHRFFVGKAPGHDEDLIQQTFVACVEARDAFRGECSFRTYLYALARFQLLTYYRAKQKGAGIDFTTTSIRDLGTSPTGELRQREERELLKHALQQIPVDQQITLELTYWEGLSAPEIARVLGIPENTVYSRLRRAREHLREVLEQLSALPAERSRALQLLSLSEHE